MDHLAHDIPPNRKRKAEGSSTEQDASSTEPAVPDAPSLPSAAPRQPWLTSDSQWPPASSQVSSPLSSKVLLSVLPSNPTKRPRLEKIETSLRPQRRPMSKKSPLKVTWSRPPPIARHGSDIEDLGIVSMADPGPSSGSLLHLRTGPKSATPPSPSSPIDINSAHIPSRHPLINRQTLKELDLDVILCNPQLRSSFSRFQCPIISHFLRY